MSYETPEALRMALEHRLNAHERVSTDVLVLPNSLAFAGIEGPTIEVINVNRHAAEKFHALSREFGRRENTRVRDLVDLVIIIEHQMLNLDALVAAVRDVWKERDAAEPPAVLPALPASWPEKYERLARDHDLLTLSFGAALHAMTALWEDLISRGT